MCNALTLFSLKPNGNGHKTSAHYPQDAGSTVGHHNVTGKE